jgi:hypothetical protein
LRAEAVIAHIGEKNDSQKVKCGGHQRRGA